MIGTIYWAGSGCVPGAVELPTIVTVLWGDNHWKGIVYREDGQRESHAGNEEALWAGTAFVNLEEGNPGGVLVRAAYYMEPAGGILTIGT